MEGKHHTIPRRMGIGLDIAVAEIDRALEGRHRILRPRARAAAMREGENAVMFEIRIFCHPPFPHPANLACWL